MSSTLTKTTISIERDVAVPMRDGVTLAADVWRAAGTEPRPVLLQRTAYDKGELHVATHHAGLDPARAIDAGFTVVIADVRGRFASEGTFAPFAQEAADGADTLAWLREQPFCDGRVCTYGTSYNGATQLLLATGADDRDGLVALSAVETASQYHDGWTHLGGAVALSFLAAWAANDLAGPELARLRAAAAEAGDDDEHARLDALAADLDARRRDPRAACERLAGGDLGALATLVPALADWLAHPDEDAFWRAVSPREGWDRVTVPGLHVGGWFDLFLEGTLETFAGLRAHAATPVAREGQRLVVGPWAHGVTGSRVGAVDFGPDAAQAALDLTALQLEHFAAALDDRLDELSPVRVFVMGEDAWRAEDAWPPARMRPVALRLHADGTLHAGAPDDAGAHRALDHDPADPVPTRGGAIVCDPALGAPGPADQREVEARDDVLVYTGAPLPEPVELIGTVRAALRVSATSPVADWSVRLTHVAPDGTSMLIADGLARVRARETAVADVADAVDVVVGSTAIVVPAGHRLRVAVAASSFPRVDVQPVAARQRVFATSAIVLPVTSGALL